MSLHVTKRNGQRMEFDAEKINKVLLWACDGISGVSASDIAMNAEIQFFPGIKTKQIHDVLIQSAVDLISEKSPNYQYVAGNLLNYLLRKEVFEVKTEMPHLWTVITNNIQRGVYDHIILEKYSTEEISALNLYMKHKRDYDFTYAGLQQLMDKYLVQHRKTKTIYETPQYAFMLIAMTVFMDHDQETRFKHIKELYDLISLQKISLSTPVMVGIRTPNRQYSSCVLVDTDDSLDSICNTNTAITKYVSKRAGIGVNMGRIRGVGSEIRGGEVVHTGMVPFLKQVQASVHSCSQGGIRKAGATIYFPWWHQEIEDVLVLKNNKGTDDNRVRHIDYGIQFSRLFYKRFVDNADISLFSPSDVPGLYDAFGYNEKFDELYLKYESNKKIKRKTINSRDLMNSYAQERIGTGRMYLMNIDNVNSNSHTINQLVMSNLCAEILLPVKPLTSIYDIDSNPLTEHLSEGEIALCVLAGHNLGNIKSWDELYKCSEYIVRLLDWVVENQDYPVNASRKMLKRRSLGVGVTNLAYWLAKNDLKYSDDSSLEKVDELFEHFQYSLLKASNKLAQELGKCEWFNETTYAQGIMPIDRYNKNVDKLVKRELSCDWETLRKEIKEYGLRNSTLSAQFPAESSSVVQNSTNGIEPVRDLIVTKRSKSGVVKQVVPEINRLKNKYELAYNMKSNNGYTNIVAIIQKWIDQSISANHYYEYSADGISLGEVIKDILYAYQMGIKTLYYANTDDKKSDNIENMGNGCDSGACAL
ncbi:MAG: ribonucleoside-diphosphate reductase subunit alpha [Spirochaetes bacterium]|nr:MAG: ribonucleoside-diphosphate reductase subunit alpha [Spirochaetota bacterium]